jgi:PAS domain S-box-containing protein
VAFHWPQTEILVNGPATAPRLARILRVLGYIILGITLSGIGLYLAWILPGDPSSALGWVEQVFSPLKLLNLLLWSTAAFWAAGLLNRTSASLQRRAGLERRVEVHSRQLADANAELETRMSELRVTAAALRKSEERYQLAISASRDAVWDIDLVTGQQFYSPRFEEMMNFQPDEPADRYKAWKARTHPDDLARVRAALREHFKHGTPYRVECRIRMTDGSYRWTLNIGQGVRDEKGWVVRMVGSTSDIDPQRRAAEALAQAAERYNFLADAMPHIVWTATPDGKFEDVNASWVKYTGLNSSEIRLLGNEAMRRVVHADEAQLFIDTWQKSVKTGEPFELEYRLRRANDDKYRWHLGLSLPRRDAEGRIVQWVGTCTDIDDQKLEQESLRQESGLYLRESRAAVEELVKSEERFALLIESSPLGFFDINLQTGEGYFSPRWKQMLGYEPLELPDQFVVWMELLHPDDLAKFSRGLRRRPGDERPRVSFSMEFRMRHREGHYVWIESNGLDFYDDSGQRVRSLGFNADISERKEAEGALREARDAADKANLAKSEFLANMSHEIRTPMNAILGFSDLLDALISDPRARSYLAAVTTSGRALLDLINDILDLSKIEAEKLELHLESTSLRSLLADIQHVFSPRAIEKGLSISLLVSPAVPERMLLDEVRIRQVLFNLVGNAAKFTERGGIRINAEVKSSQKNGAPAKYYDLTLEVSDSGIGIPANEVDRIFEAFTQASGQSTRKYGGTGLGLSITKRLVEHMGGSITVQSRQGRGSTFQIVLPGVAAADGSPTTVHDQRNSLVGLEQFAPSDILIGVNTAVDQLLFTGYFEESGHRIVMAEEGETILELAEETKPAVLILDFRGAGMDGPEIARRCKANPALIDIPIILCTGYIGDDSDALHAIAEGILQKPISKRDLVVELRRYLPTRPGFDRAAAAAAGAIPEPVVIAMTEDRAQWPMLVERLRIEEKDIWPSFREAPNIDEVEAFARRLCDRAATYACPALNRYARDLVRQSQEFDMESLPRTLERFPHLINDLEAACSPERALVVTPRI